MNRERHRPKGHNTIPHPDQPAWWDTDEWTTPPEIIAALEAEFGPFDLDPCAREASAKGVFYYTKEDNGLLQPWDGRVFVNPPYSCPRLWVQKAWTEVQRSDGPTLIVMLLPTATDTNWFHEYCVGKAEIRFIKGRIKFYGWQGTPIGSPTGGSLFVIYRRADASNVG
jgi:site-specific DNA-methyltransferase (adenine-specific)